MKSLYEPPYCSPVTWKCLLAVAEFLLDVTFLTIISAEVVLVLAWSVFPALANHLGLKPRPDREKEDQAARSAPE